MDIKKLKPIPKSIIRKAKKLDDSGYTHTSFYAYFSTIDKELVLVTIACKTFDKQWFCKQVVVHGINSEECYVRDTEYSLFGFTTGWYERGISKQRQLYNDNDWCKADDRYYNLPAKILNKKFPTHLEKFKYSMADKYSYADIMKYLKLYLKYPKTEYLMKLNLQQFVTKESILKKLDKDKNFRKYIINYKTELANADGQGPYYSAKTILYGFKNKISPLKAFNNLTTIKEIKEDYDYKRIQEIIPISEILTLSNYLTEQKTNLSCYKDYISACKFLNLNLSLNKNRYPKEFMRWHDIRIDEMKTRKAEFDEEERKELYNQFSSVANKYLPLERSLKEDYVTIIAKSPRDLVKEGEKLKHCVGKMNYDQKFAREESLIFFIRLKSNPETPLVTLEYGIKNHKVLQCYGEHDTKPCDEILNYVNKVWLPYANRKIKQVA